MAWYNAGTVTATLNSGTVTGVGTAFISNIRVGDGITISGSTSVHEVTNIASETSLTISPVYPGATGSGKTYSVIPVQGYVKDSADQLRTLIGQFGTTITGLGTSSTLNATVAQTSAAINLPTTSVVRVGEAVHAARAAFGLYENGSGVNVDTLLSGSVGLYGTTTTGTKPPNTGLGFWWIETQQTYSGSSRYQRAVNYAGSATSGANLKPRQWMRISNQPGSAWGPWAEFYSTETLLGTVSQSSGTPTGSVIERGSNANGEYVKFADGTMICTSVGRTTTFVNASNINTAWTYPVAFVAVPVVNVNIVSSTVTTQRQITAVCAYTRSATSATCAALSIGQFISSDASLVLDCKATGRWF